MYKYIEAPCIYAYMEEVHVCERDLIKKQNEPERNNRENEGE